MSIEFIGNNIAKIVDGLAFIKSISSEVSKQLGDEIDNQIYNCTWHLADEIVDVIGIALHDAIEARQYEIELEELKAAMNRQADKKEVA